MYFLNCLAKDLKNAEEVIAAANGKVLIGIMMRNFAEIDDAKKTVEEWNQKIPGHVSLGMGDADPAQGYKVQKISQLFQVAHINQVFPLAAATKATAKATKAICNAQVAPAGKPGFVLISTGPLSTATTPAVVAVETVAAMAKEAGVDSIKFFSIKDMKSDEEFITLAKAVASAGLWLEPTGGLDVETIGKYARLAHDAGVTKLIPHAYTSLVNKETGETDPTKVKKICEILDQLFA